MDIQTAVVHTCSNTASILKSTTRIRSPAVRYCKSAPNLRLKPLKRNSRHFSMASSIRIAVVGDVHDDWDLEEDRKALQYLKPDLVLFTGRLSYLLCFLYSLNSTDNGNVSCDFGNENVDLVKSIADLEIAKAIILGNHDAWNTSQFSGNLGDEHVGFRRMDLHTLKLSIIGGRPFSCGGSQLFRKKLLIARYAVHDMNRSAEKIYENAVGAPQDHSVIFLAHNGPTGLGSAVDDICGKDWWPEGGDHGDPDLAQAISRLKETAQLRAPLVVFGHMHKDLAYGGHRKMVVVGEDNTIYLNGAIVPRVKRVEKDNCTLRAFTIADILDGRVEKITETWVSVAGNNTTLEKEQLMFSSNHQQPSTTAAAGAVLLRRWGSRREKRGDGDLTVETPPLQIYRAFRDEPPRTNHD
nr:Calcineurin-like metallo-phosphoesterase superfamily protein isoform 1 [Ipomoea batatas]